MSRSLEREREIFHDCALHPYNQKPGEFKALNYNLNKGGIILKLGMTFAHV